MTWKTCLLLRSEVLQLLGNRFTADRMYSLHRWENLQQQLQLLLSQKGVTFSEIFIAFSESTQDFPHFEKKDHLHSLNISEVNDHDKYGFLQCP